VEKSRESAKTFGERKCPVFFEGCAGGQQEIKVLTSSDDPDRRWVFWWDYHCCE
jgi:hypothetical protein